MGHYDGKVREMGRTQAAGTNEKSPAFGRAFVVKGKIKDDFTRRTGSPVRGFGTATTKPEKYETNACMKTLFV